MMKEEEGGEGLDASESGQAIEIGDTYVQSSQKAKAMLQCASIRSRPRYPMLCMPYNSYQSLKRCTTQRNPFAAIPSTALGRCNTNSGVHMQNAVVYISKCYTFLAPNSFKSKLVLFSPITSGMISHRRRRKGVVLTSTGILLSCLGMPGAPCERTRWCWGCRLCCACPGWAGRPTGGCCC